MRIAIDTGGTFTDCLFLRNGRLEILKLPSTRDNPARAIAEALEAILGRPNGQGDLELTCGTTVGTNALIERRGGRVSLVTTAGFEDVIEIGRQDRPQLYDFFVTRPEPLVPRERRFGLAERFDAEGHVLLRPTERELDRLVREVERSRPEAVAVCLLFSFANPAHERALARRLRRRGFPVSVSHEILAEFREYERTATTVANAYLSPAVSGYLDEVKRRASRWRGAHVRVMQSNGGIVSAALAAREPVRTVLSGPAGGVLGARSLAALAGFDRIISFDMGGTSTDVSLIEGEPRPTTESHVASLPVAVPMLEIHTVGAGGGSIARFDAAGALRVGPESAGAEPGPICYGRGEQPTVTDAHLVLGRLAPEGLLGGRFPLDEARARRFMERARGPIGSVEEFAVGILTVANATMEKAIRVISIERGHDTRDYTLVAFGGAGGLHACGLAMALGIPRVLVPRFPGGLSALGILSADVVKDFSRTVLLEVSSRAAVRTPLRRAFAEIEARGWRDMRAEGLPRSRVRIERWLDLRYVGQGYELAVPAAGDFLSAFHRAHERRYGYSDRSWTVELVNVRSRFIGRTPGLPLRPRRSVSRSALSVAVGHRPVVFTNHGSAQQVATTLYDRSRLLPGHRLAGPAIVFEYSATTAIPPGWKGRVDRYENLILEPVRR
jgi:N-methylhydantoinase A